MALSAALSCRSATSRFEPLGSTAFQLLCLPYSPLRTGITAIGGSIVLRLSPQVKSTPMPTEKNRKEIEAVPCTCQGVGPDSARSMSMPYTPMPKTLTLNDIEIETLNWNGEN